jgi:hypothetical protein
VGVYSVYIKYIFYGDDDSSGTYTNGDTMFQVETSNPVYFELTNDPYITGVNPKEYTKGDRVKVIGLNFGPTANDNGFVFIGSKNQYLGDCIDCECYGNHCFRYNAEADWDVLVPPSGTGGKLQDPVKKVKMWSSTKIKVKATPPGFGKMSTGDTKKKYIWVVKDGKVSNAYKTKVYK